MKVQVPIFTGGPPVICYAEVNGQDWATMMVVENCRNIDCYSEEAVCPYQKHKTLHTYFTSNDNCLGWCCVTQMKIPEFEMSFTAASVLIIFSRLSPYCSNIYMHYTGTISDADLLPT